MPPKRDPLAQALDAARALREAPDDAGLRRALRFPHGWVVAVAAEIVAERALEGLLDEVAAACERLYTDPVKRDPGCKGKVAAIAALDAAGSLRAEPFERGVVWEQHEPAWGGTIDTAPPLRSTCLFALARLNPVDLWGRFADGLVDPNPNVRSAAARAIAWRGDAAIGVPLLRLFVGQGDPQGDGEVLSDAMTAMISLDRAQLGWVIRRLGHGSASVRQAAALAVGDARLAEGFAPLRDAFDAAAREDRRVLLLAMAMLRHPPATAFLLELAATGERPDAYAAVGALAVLIADPKVGEALQAVAIARPPLRDAVQTALAGDATLRR